MSIVGGVSSNESISVAVRVRPFYGELEQSQAHVVGMLDSSTIVYHPDTLDEPLEKKKYDTFSFDFSYWSFPGKGPSGEEAPFATQETVYKDFGPRILDNAFEGKNSSILAYGQTAAGKTYSIMGTPDNPGLLQRVCEGLFHRANDSKVEYKVEASYLEIYAEKVRDLLFPDTPQCRIRQVGSRVYVEGLGSLAVESYPDILHLLEQGTRFRAVAATKMNKFSSRSHAIFTITFTHLHLATLKERRAFIKLVDLAGSERISRTGAVGLRFQEGVHINKSLSQLRTVIERLADNSKTGKKRYVDYRSSALTHLLQDSLGGNSKTVVIAAISPAASNYWDTISTLKYADAAKKIKNVVTINEDHKTDLLQLIAVLQKQLTEARKGNQDKVSDLQFQLNQIQGEMERLKRSREEVLAEAKTQEEQRLQHFQQQGLVVQLPSDMPYLSNLNEDPWLCGTLIYIIHEGETKVGNDVKSTIVLTGLGIEEQHCTIYHESESVSIVPRNGDTFVNGERLSSDRTLSNGDRVVFGDLFFRFIDPREAARSRSVHASTSTGSIPTTPLFSSLSPTLGIEYQRDVQTGTDQDDVSSAFKHAQQEVQMSSTNLQDFLEALEARYKGNAAELISTIEQLQQEKEKYKQLALDTHPVTATLAEEAEPLDMIPRTPVTLKKKLDTVQTLKEGNIGQLENYMGFKSGSLEPNSPLYSLGTRRGSVSNILFSLKPKNRGVITGGDLGDESLIISSSSPHHSHDSALKVGNITKQTSSTLSSSPTLISSSSSSALVSRNDTNVTVLDSSTSKIVPNVGGKRRGDPIQDLRRIQQEAMELAVAVNDANLLCQALIHFHEQWHSELHEQKHVECQGAEVCPHYPTYERFDLNLVTVEDDPEVDEETPAMGVSVCFSPSSFPPYSPTSPRVQIWTSDKFYSELEALQLAYQDLVELGDPSSFIREDGDEYERERDDEEEVTESEESHRFSDSSSRLRHHMRPRPLTAPLRHRGPAFTRAQSTFVPSSSEDEKSKGARATIHSRRSKAAEEGAPLVHRARSSMTAMNRSGKRHSHSRPQPVYEDEPDMIVAAAAPSPSSLSPPEDVAEGELSVIAEHEQEEAVWFFVKEQDDPPTHVGPLTRSQVISSFKAENIPHNTRCWRPGMSEWRPASVCDGLQPELGAEDIAQLAAEAMAIEEQEETNAGTTDGQPENVDAGGVLLSHPLGPSESDPVWFYLPKGYQSYCGPVSSRDLAMALLVNRIDEVTTLVWCCAWPSEMTWRPLRQVPEVLEWLQNLGSAMALEDTSNVTSGNTPGNNSVMPFPSPVADTFPSPVVDTFPSPVVNTVSIPSSTPSRGGGRRQRSSEQDNSQQHKEGAPILRAASVGVKQQTKSTAVALRNLLSYLDSSATPDPSIDEKTRIEMQIEGERSRALRQRQREQEEADEDLDLYLDEKDALEAEEGSNPPHRSRRKPRRRKKKHGTNAVAQELAELAQLTSQVEMRLQRQQDDYHARAGRQGQQRTARRHHYGDRGDPNPHIYRSSQQEMRMSDEDGPQAYPHQHHRGQHKKNHGSRRFRGGSVASSAGEVVGKGTRHSRAKSTPSGNYKPSRRRKVGNGDVNDVNAAGGDDENCMIS